MKKDVQVVKKQSLIDKTRKSVIILVAGASMVVGAMIVVSGLFIQSLLFNNKVMKVQNETISTLNSNIEAVPELKGDVLVLNTNEQLLEARSSSDAKALQTVLDALPADANRLALGASLEQKIFKDISGLTVQSLSVDPSIGSVDDGSTTDTGELGTLTFSATISGTPEALKLGLQRLERSIRSMNVQTINGTTSGNNVSLTVVGVAYYLKPVDLNLTDTKVRG
jgi:hypothetical protein